MRQCLRDPVPEIFLAAADLDRAVSAHLRGNREEARALIAAADLPAIRKWSDSLWGPSGPWSRPISPGAGPAAISADLRVPARMPNSRERLQLHERDGYHCRFCGIPVIRKEVRDRIKMAYPESLPWGRTNVSQHASFQAMWVQYDHLLPHARGGTNDLSNLVITCAPCNYGRWYRTLEEVGLENPLLRPPRSGPWDGLERFRTNGGGE